MTPDISNAKNADLRNSYQAMLRAAEMARITAIQTGTYLVVHRGGRLINIDPITRLEITPEQPNTAAKLFPIPQEMGTKAADDTLE